MKSFYTVTEAAEMARKSNRTILNHIKANRIGSRKRKWPGGDYYIIPARSLYKYIEDCRTNAKALAEADRLVRYNRFCPKCGISLGKAKLAVACPKCSAKITRAKTLLRKARA